MNFLGDPFNDYCEMCLCSWFCVDVECACDCHGFDEIDWGDGDEE